MDKYYLQVEPDELTKAMECYTVWLDDQIKTAQQQFVDRAVDQN